MVTITLGKLATSTTALSLLANEKMGAMVSYKVAKIVKIIQDELETYNKTKQKIFKEYGETNEDGSMKIKEENVDEATKELKELDETKIELKINKIPLNELSKVELSPSVFMVLDFMVKE